MKNKDFAFFRVTKIIGILQTCAIGFYAFLMIVRSITSIINNLNAAINTFYFATTISILLVFSLLLVITINLSKFEIIPRKNLK